MGKAAEAKKQAEEQKRLADVKIRAQMQELQRQRAAQAAAQNAAKPPAAKPAMRVWTNVTGERTVTAKFVEILDKKTVVLQLESGEIRKVPLSRLSEADIYEAVRADLMRQGTDAAADESPF
jgi:ATP-dependent 26S proteasome regulatory subunit